MQEVLRQSDSAEGQSRALFQLPWNDDPLLNIQPRGKQAKPEQVKDAVRAIERLLGQ